MVQLRAGLPSPCLTLTVGDGLFDGRPVKESTKENDSQKIAVFLAEVQTTDLQLSDQRIQPHQKFKTNIWNLV